MSDNESLSELMQNNMRKIIPLLWLLCAIATINAQKFEPKWVGQVVVLTSLDGDTVAVATEKASVQVKTNKSAGKLIVGIGNVRQKVYVKGNASPVQLDPEEPITLIVKCRDNDTDPNSFIQIVEFEKGKTDRRTEWARSNWLGNFSHGNMKIIPYEADVYGRSSYIITIQPTNGEFGVRVQNPNNLDETIPIFYCFGTSTFGMPDELPRKKPVFARRANKDGSDSEDVKDGTIYEYKNLSYTVYKKPTGERYIVISKDKIMYLPEE